jgi:hypothetical protein
MAKLAQAQGYKLSGRPAAEKAALEEVLLPAETVRSRITCQRIEGSESSSQRMTDLSGFGACRSGGLVIIRWLTRAQRAH